MKKYILVLILIATTTLAAQFLPITNKKLTWDAAAYADDYLVTLDGITIGTTSALEIPFTISTLGTHTFTVTARNSWSNSTPSILTVTVQQVGNSSNLRIK